MQRERVAKEPKDKDFWVVRADLVIRYHRIPRKTLFAPDEEGAECPIPHRYLDILRLTETSLEDDVAVNVPSPRTVS